MSPASREKIHRFLLLVVVLLLAAVSARPHAGGWNDGSRLAAVESLADRGTWSIDHSLFVRTPGVETRNAGLGYPEDQPLLRQHGTLDKLLINGRYYSDKSPVPALIMAGAYKSLHVLTGLSASENAPLFCYIMALLFSGGAYVVSVLCMDSVAARLALPFRTRLLFTWSFALATVALPYARHVNNHIMLLAVFSAVMLLAVALTQPGGDGKWRVVLLGTLMGIGYTIDLGAGPVLVLAVTGFVAAQTRSFGKVALVLAASFPWFLLHHLLNYHIGGVFKPANAVIEYLAWPGSPFSSANATGGWMHANAGKFSVYALSMLFGKRGFIGHNLPLFLCIPAALFLIRKREGPRPLVWMSLGLAAGTWILYAITSNNSSGLSCSIRWFVPLLAPSYCLLALFLQKRPEHASSLIILSAWGVLLGGFMWVAGPWLEVRLLPLLLIEAGALLSCIAWHMIQRRKSAGLSAAAA